MIDITLDRDCIAVGETVSGTYSNASPQRQKLDLVISWHTEGRGNNEQEIIYQTKIQPSSSGVPFSCSIPLSGPVSYDGELLRIIWEVEILQPTLLGSESLDSEVFRVVPRTTRRRV